MIRNFTIHGSYPVTIRGRQLIEETFTVEILTDGVEGVWERYKARVLRGWFTNGTDLWDTFTSVDKKDGSKHWRNLCERRNRRRHQMVKAAIKSQLKKAAA